LHLVAALGAPDFASWLVDALLGESETDAEEILDRLVETRLLDVTGIDAAGQVRYRCHDLIRRRARRRGRRRAGIAGMRWSRPARGIAHAAPKPPDAPLAGRPVRL
jgi:hypothetical protein